MKIAFFSTKTYDREFFDRYVTTHQITYYEGRLRMPTVELTKGCDAVCVFVNDRLNAEVIAALKQNGVKLIALRCAGFNNVDLAAAAANNIKVVRVPAYSPEAVSAEKLHAMVMLGSRNSRLKDYFYLHALLRAGALDARRSADAIAATFERRQTALPVDAPVGLSDEFARDAAKQAQWQAFLNKNGLHAPALGEVVAEIRAFMTGPLELARQRKGAP